MPANLAEFLTIGGVAIVLGFFQSYIVELWPAWEDVPAQWKRVIMSVIAVVLTVGVQAINQYVPGETIAMLDPWYVAIVAGIQLVTAEYTHAKIK